jgi:ATP-dependent DNA helicase PIF1
MRQGTGKSVLLRAIIDHFGGGPSLQLAITASTGIAAVNIGGCTLHSWAGIGLGKESETKLYFKLKNNERWCSVKTLIIDESN